MNPQLVSVREIIQKSTDYFAKRGVDSPRLQIELILAHVLSVPRLNLYLDLDRRLDEVVLERVRELTRRRGTREPLQHILGSASFCGIELRVNRNALIPRPETELLAELGWEFLAEAKAVAQPVALDFGTGSGCLAIALAAKCPTALVHALDISEAALALARENAVRHGLEGRVQFHLGNGFAALPAGLQIDLVVANPPYIASNEIASLQPEVRDHDPRLALDGGGDGLDFYRRLAAESRAWLAPGGRIMLEFGDGQAEQIAAIFVEHKYVVHAVTPDYSGRPRNLIASAGTPDT